MCGSRYEIDSVLCALIGFGAAAFLIARTTACRGAPTAAVDCLDTAALLIASPALSMSYRG